MAYRQSDIKKRELRDKRRNAAGLVSERYPRVSDIVITMTYFHKAADPVLMKRTMNISPENHADFFMECMIGNCENGGFDLTPIISGLIKKKKKSSTGTMDCKGKNGKLASDHASLSYEISVKYKKVQTKRSSSR